MDKITIAAYDYQHSLISAREFLAQIVLGIVDVACEDDLACIILAEQLVEGLKLKGDDNVPLSP
jgi:hypothetical protein